MPKNDEKILKPGRDIVASMADAFRKDLLSEVAEGVKKLTIDLDGVEMVDSVGIGVLVATHNSLSKSGGSMAVSNVCEDLCRLFRTMRLDQHFEVTPAKG